MTNRTEKILESLNFLLNEENLVGKDEDYVHNTLSSEAKAIHDHTHTPNRDGSFKIDPKHEALKEYVDHSYRTINKHLRKIKHGPGMIITPEMRKTTNTHIKNLKSLTKSQTNHSFTAYRGSGHLGDLKEGSIIHDKGFTSVSTRADIASNFKHSGGDDSKPGHKFKIHVPEGTKGYYASGHTGIFAGEKEFVLHPGTKFRVGHTEKDDRGRDDWTHLHIHSQED